MTALSAAAGWACTASARPSAVWRLRAGMAAWPRLIATPGCGRRRWRSWAARWPRLIIATPGNGPRRRRPWAARLALAAGAAAAPQAMQARLAWAARACPGTRAWAAPLVAAPKALAVPRAWPGTRAWVLNSRPTSWAASTAWAAATARITPTAAAARPASLPSSRTRSSCPSRPRPLSRTPGHQGSSRPGRCWGTPSPGRRSCPERAC
mmetsp:Transcript_108599/g.350588  ORF Transcript_108599/g.350588 Transcript_108599/m.350588 type:complete len:209 (+) Transcript_108599:1798-2424(+)